MPQSIAAPPRTRRGGLRRYLGRLVRRVLPFHTYVPLRMEMHMAWVRWKSRSMPARYAHCTGLLVNLGAGEQGATGWVNVDAYARPGVNCVYDARRRLPFPDASVRGIFCEHFLEHLDYVEEAPIFLRECCRVLQPGGVLRLIVPDAERYLRAYCAGGWDELTRIRPLVGDRVDFYSGGRYNTRLELVNFVFRQGAEHRYAYDGETLEHLLRTVGFQRIVRQEFGRSLLPELCLDQSLRAPESLYMEAAKAGPSE